MKVYTRVVIDMTTLEVIEAESFDYAGPVAECKGGGSAPPPPPAPPKPVAQKDVQESVTAARESQKQKAKASFGQQSTIMSGALGMDSPAQTDKKLLLGQ